MGPGIVVFLLSGFFLGFRTLDLRSWSNVLDATTSKSAGNAKTLSHPSYVSNSAVSLYQVSMNEWLHASKYGLQRQILCVTLRNLWGTGSKCRKPYVLVVQHACHTRQDVCLVKVRWNLIPTDQLHRSCFVNARMLVCNYVQTRGCIIGCNRSYIK